MTGSPDPVDVHVGAFIRARRKRLGVSQQKLAEALGLTFQQVQKYERGVNRISASKLWVASRVLEFEPGDAFEGLGRDGAISAGGPDPILRFAGCPGAHEIALAYPALKPDARVAMLAVTRALKDVH